MSTQGPEDGLVVRTDPVVSLTRISQIDTFEVMDTELDALDQIVSEENRAASFASLGLGVFASAGLGMVGASSLSPTALAIYAATLGVSALATAWFGLAWKSVSSRRPKLLAKIRQRNAQAGTPTPTRT